MKKIGVYLFLFAGITTSAQNVGINSTGVNPDNSAMLDVASSNTGVLIPRVVLTATNLAGPITTPASSLLVYNTASAGTGVTAVSPGYYYNSGTPGVPIWTKIATDEEGWKITGNGNTAGGTNFLGTTNAQSLDFRTNNILRFSLPNADQVHAMANGTEALPFYSWSADPNTGIWSDNADELNLGAGGVEFISMEKGATDVLIINEDSDNAFDIRMESSTDVNMFFLDGSTNSIGIGTNMPLSTFHVVGTERVSTLAGVGNRMVIADANGVLGVQAIPLGDITAVTAGTGLTGGGTSGAITLNALGTNGLTTNANDIILGGSLIQATTISQGTNEMNFNLNSTGDFNIQDNGINHFSVSDNGNIAFGGDVEWRDDNTGGTILAQIIDENNDGRFVLRENGIISVDLRAANSFTFNQQGLDRDFRIEGNTDNDLFLVDAGNDRIGISNTTPDGTLSVEGSFGVSTGNDGVITGVNANGTGYGISIAGQGRTMTGLGAGGGAALVGDETAISAVYNTAGNGEIINGRDAFGASWLVGTWTGAAYRKIIGDGTVSTVVDDLDGNKVIMNCPEAPENLFMDYGHGELVNGRCHINIDPILTKNIIVNEEHPLKVFIQLEGDCIGVFVTNKSAEGFDVVELQGGNSNVSFTYSIVAIHGDQRYESKEGHVKIARYDKRWETLPSAREWYGVTPPSNLELLNPEDQK